MKHIGKLAAEIAALSLLFSTAFANASSANNVHPEPVIVAYVFPRDAVLKPGQIDANSLTRINYAFANIQNGKIVTGSAVDEQNFAYLAGLRKDNPSLKVLVSVGGWLWSTNFSDVSVSAKSRKIFADSVIDFLSRNQLDGLDVDWEYPGMPGAGHPFRSQDKHNFTLLLKDLRKRFDSIERKSHQHLYLTFAGATSEEYLQHTEMGLAQRYVDTVNLMAYDFAGSYDSVTSHHAPLYTNPASPKKGSADSFVQAYERAGVPPEKIVLGVPFYGHAWAQVGDENHGLFQPAKPPKNEYYTYAVIAQTLIGHGFTRYWDSVASAPYLYSAEQQTFITYEDSESLALKCHYVLSNKLGGIMFWEYFGDPTGELLGTINHSLHAEPANKP